MKLLILLTVVACFQVSGRGFGQRITLDMKDVSLEVVFKEIRKQTGYSFVYTREQVKRSQDVTIQVQNVDLNTVLDQCFRDQPLSYLIKDRYIVIQNKRNKPEVAGEKNFLIDVSGKVINESKEPLVGVTVFAKRSGKTSVTNENGEFSLQKIHEDDILVLTSIGYFKQEIEVNNRNQLLIQMDIAIGSLDETIVMAYGKTSQRLNTGNIAKISAEEISRAPVANPLAAMQGRVPGVTIVQSNGIPGSAFRILIRGRNSVQQGTEPLFVIDGVPFAPNNSNINNLASIAASSIGAGLSPFNSINPSDIESIEVLKDADATAIYGSRGANGVVLITTKKGNKGKAKINLKFYSGISKVTKVPRFLNTKEYLSMRRDAFQSDGIVADATNAPDLLIWDTSRYTDFAKMLIGGTASIADFQGSISGGSKSTYYSFGLGLHRETTVLPGDMSDTRSTFKASFTHQSEDRRLSLNFLTTYSYDNNKLLPSNEAIQLMNLPPNLPSLYDSVGNLKWEEGGVTFDNPLATFLRKYKMKVENLIANFQVSYRINNSLSIKSSFGLNSFATDEIGLYPKNSLNPAISSTGFAQFAYGYKKSWIAEPQIEYSKFFKGQKFSILLGSTIQQLTNRALSIYASGYTNDALIESLAGASTIEGFNEYSRYRYMALFGRINYNLSDKYIVNLSGRRDGSSRFGPNSRISNFGALGVAWIFSSEPFMANNISWLSYGKLRASYGVTGNDQIGDYRYLDSWTNTSYPYQSISGLFPIGLFNPDFEWERTRKFEVSADLGFLKDRLMVNATFFQNRSGNQLINYILPSQTGSQSILKNFPAKIENRGFEFLITSQNISKKNFEWVTSINLTIPKNRLLSFPNIEQTSYRFKYVIGESLNLLYNFQYNGIDPLSGLYTFEDIDKDGNITLPNDIKVNGTLDPKFYGGVSNSINFKGWRFDFLFEFKNQLGQNYMATYKSVPPGKMFNQLAVVLSRWGINESPNVGRLTTQSFGSTYNSINNLSQSDGIFSNASFVRLKNVSLSYCLKPSQLRKLKLEGCRVYFLGQNLFTISDFPELDPETQHLLSLPPLKTFVLGINISI